MPRFYDPHNGFAGAAIPLPAPIKRVVDDLDGKDISIESAISQIEMATKGYRTNIAVKNGCILLELSMDSYPIHCFRLIRFEEK